VAIIREHNRLNGLGFSIVEFVLIGAVALYVAVGGGLGMLIGVGIALNMAMIAVVGMRQVRDGEPAGGGPWRMFDRRYREEVARAHPDLGRNTTMLVVTSLVPYLLTGLVIVQRSGIQARPAGGGGPEAPP
jgi:hypothetical protein